MNKYDVLVIGGGAAGFFAAINVAEKHPNKRIAILEKTNKLLSKVKVSGGGRCNVTNRIEDPEELALHYPRGTKEVKRLFYQFGSREMKSWLAERGVSVHTEDDGRVFPDTNSSQTVIDLFMELVRNLKIDIHTRCDVHQLMQTEQGEYLLESSLGTWQGEKVVIASGGAPSLDKLNYLNELGLKTISPVPSLFTFNLKEKPDHGLQGLSVQNVQVRVQGNKKSVNGPVLFTHWGFSGPGVIRMSAVLARDLHESNYSYTVMFNWLNKTEDETRDFLREMRQEQGQKKISNTSIEGIPKRLWLYFLEQTDISPDCLIEQLSKKDINRLVQKLFNDQYECQGKTTFKEEFVTCGGISRKEVDYKTMESRKYPGLYFAGEVLDVDGVTGGFNFQHAWSGAWVISENIYS